MKMVYTNQNNLLVELAKNLLLKNGIQAILKNEYSSAGTGELSAIDTWPELWVLLDQEVELALSLISDASKSDSEDWLCTFCSEKNDDSFDICWKCQSEQPG